MRVFKCLLVCKRGCGAAAKKKKQFEHRWRFTLSGLFVTHINTYKTLNVCVCMCMYFLPQLHVVGLHGPRIAQQLQRR